MDESWVKYHDCGELTCCECISSDHCCHLCPQFVAPSFNFESGFRETYVEARPDSIDELIDDAEVKGQLGGG